MFGRMGVFQREIYYRERLRAYVCYTMVTTQAQGMMMVIIIIIITGGTVQ